MKIIKRIPEFIRLEKLRSYTVIIKNYLQSVSIRLWIAVKGKIPQIKKAFAGAVFVLGIFIFSHLLQRILITIKLHSSNTITISTEQARKVKSKIEKEIYRLDRKLLAKIPGYYYLIINSSANDFYLYKNTQLIRKDKCSTGSYILLKNGDEQQWMFKTPKGEFRIQGKTTSPVWKKPDWAFVEEGLSVPSPNHYSRYEYGVLGDYALSLGHGYLIHGTLYQRFLGLPVTHGCIRLNDENLYLVYKSLTIGSKVYIY